jgi:diacylglycerol kinase family enzyme
MYYYILDTHGIPQKDFERSQTELQGLLTEFNINGEMARVTPLRIIKDLVDTAANRGATTLIACGTDQTFNQVLASIRDHEFTLGFVPFVPNTQLGKILGFKDIQTAAKTIASRRTEHIDVARINNQFFISYLEMGLGQYTNQSMGIFSLMKLFATNPVELKMRIDDSYTITSKVMGALIVNTRGTVHETSNIGNPQDGFLDLLLLERMGKLGAMQHKAEILTGEYEKIPGATAIRCKKIEILEPNNHKIFIDGKETYKTPATIEVTPSKFRMIVGKDRTF